jgi:calcium-translocating P-type ATPase
MNYFTQKLSEIYQELKTNPDTGLTNDEVVEIQKIKGLNVFDEEKKDTVLQKILHHLKDVTSLILLVAGFIALYLALTGQEDGKSFTDAIVIFSIVILNVSMAVRQEMGAEKALEALKKMTAQMTVVIRNGKKQTINSEQLVPGDILSLKAGDMIPADARIIESVNLKVEEAVLTGESVPVEKNADVDIDDKATIGDRFNMLYSSCLVTFGNAKAVVTQTGMSTEIGRIAGLLNQTVKERTPLQQKITKLCKLICIAAISSGTLLYLLQTFSKQLNITDYIIPITQRLLDSVVLAVAAIPEGLPIILTITLAYSILNMAKKNAIIRKMPAVETLGSASIICSDKTGTLTMNRMAIQKLWAVNHEPIDAQGAFNHDQMRILEMMSLASNASITIEDGEERAVGDPTETAIIRLLRDKHIEKDSLDAIFPRVHEIPFDSNRKLMTTVHETDDLEDTVKYISITKGAFDRIPIAATSFCADRARRIHDEFADDALRVIAVAYKYYDKLPAVLDENELENGLIFAGFVGMIDPARPESKMSVQIAKEAGIKTVMITGDHAKTASAIARDLGILCENDKVITGVELASMSQEYLAKNVKEYSVYARVSPEDKIRIVQAWQSYDAVVAMTGDGVNDAPALKAADVGVAMGSGTDVSKSASDVILTDDNFASIVSAISEGRRVYDNIRKVIISLVPSNISEIVAMILGFITWGVTPFAAVQLLFINVIADGIPDLCMCREKLEPDAMKRKPIPKAKSIFAYGLLARTFAVAVNFTIVVMLGYALGRFVLPSPDPEFYCRSLHFDYFHAVGRTMAFVTLAWASVVNIMNVRSFNQSLFSIGFTSNPLLFAGVIFSLSLTAIVATVPGLQQVFHCVSLSALHWVVMVGMAITPFILIEIWKVFIRRGQAKECVS